MTIIITEKEEEDMKNLFPSEKKDYLAQTYYEGKRYRDLCRLDQSIIDDILNS